MSTLYRQDGVNLSLGDKFSAFAHVQSKTTWNVPHIDVQEFSSAHFRGPRAWGVTRFCRGYSLVPATDGVGTKSAFESLESGRDLLAMILSDLTRYGALPCMVTNVLDVATLGEDEQSDTYKTFCKIFENFAHAAREQGVVLLGGETAELGAFVGSENPNAVVKFNWAGAATGIIYQPKIITGEKVKAGDVVVALGEQGFRSNGISAVRKALRMKFGDSWWSEPSAQPAIKKAAAPSLLYDRMLSEANGWFQPNYMEPLIPMQASAHISGGGIPGKFGDDILRKRGLSAMLDTLPLPPDIMLQCKEWRGLSSREAYEVWHSGPGILVVLEPVEVTHFLHLASIYGFTTQVAGKITTTKKGKSPTLTIVSQYPGGDKKEHLTWRY